MSDFKLEHGKRYVTRDGRVTDGPVWDMLNLGPIANKDHFVGSVNGRVHFWDDDGSWGNSKTAELDLVAEYVPPPEPKWVPFGCGDCTHLTGRVIRGKRWNKSETALISHSCDLGVTYTLRESLTVISLAKLLDDYTFADGTPCGKQVQ